MQKRFVGAERHQEGEEALKCAVCTKFDIEFWSIGSPETGPGYA
jgi:hypothetical protein